MSNYENLIKWADWLDDIAPGQPGNTEDSESVQFLLHFCTEDEARVAMMLEPYFKPLAQIAEEHGVKAEDIEPVLEGLCLKGFIMSSAMSGTMMYRRWPWLPGILEFVVLGELEPELLRYASEFYEKRIRLVDMTGMPFMQPAHGGLRTIPIMEAVEAGTKIMSFEQIKPFLDKGTKFSIANCACRVSMRAIGMGCEHTHIDTCIQIDDYADFAIRTRRGREISREEAVERMKELEKQGHVHQIFNTTGHDSTCFICNCCGCGCASIRTANMLNLQHNMGSNFVAKVDPEKCVACGACVEKCNSNALSLGTTFCEGISETKDLPDYMETNWTEEYWDKDYLVRKMVNKTGTAPCKVACPAHISIQGYIKKAAEGNYVDALKVIKRDNPFPAVCGRICPHDCENECTRARVDEAMAIDDIKKFIADKELDEATRFIPEKKADYSDMKVAIIGAGPAGMTAAYYLAVEGYTVTMFERNAAPGGMLKFGIPSFRLEKDVIDAEIDILHELGVEFKCGVDVGKDVTIAQLREQGYKAFYVAIGAQGVRKLNVEGENLIGVIGGIDFLRGVNEGKLDKIAGDTVVIGGGNVAVDVARAAMRLGNKKVKMVCLEKDEEMPTVPDEKDEAIAEGIEILNSWGPKRILGENGIVTGVEFMRCVSVFDENGNFAPKYDENETMVVPCTNVYTAIGQSICWGDLMKGTAAEVSEGKVMPNADISYQTAEPDIFVGGDCATGPKFTIDAIATGKSGAISVHRYVQGKNLLIRREREYKPFDKDAGDYSGFDKQPRQRPHHAAPSKALETMSDTRATFTEEQLKKEAQRCMGCGVTIVDEHKCMGCGVCTIQCEFDAIKLVRARDAVPPTGPEEWAAAMGANIQERMGRIAAKAAVVESGTSNDVAAEMMAKRYEDTHKER